MAKKKRESNALTKITGKLPVKKLTPYLDGIELTKKQRDFAFYYVMTDQDIIEAVKLAGYSEKYNNKMDEKKYHQCLMTVGYQNLQRHNIQQAIKKIIEKEIEIAKIPMEYNIFKKLQLVMDLDILEYLTDDGEVKSNFKDIPKPIRQCIKKVETKYYGKDAQVRVVSLEILGKEFAIQTFMKYIGMLKEQPVNNVINLIAKQQMLNILNGDNNESDNN